MSIEIFRTAEDGLSRQKWHFSVSFGYGDIAKITLTSYGIERRAKPKGRFSQALPGDRWMAHDEREYTSGLDRPTGIPADILSEAEDALQIRFYIGWPIEEHALGRRL